MNRLPHHRRRRPSAYIWLVASWSALAVLGCARSETVLCGDDLRCTLGFECAAAQDVCIPIGGCGNGVVDTGEDCDDGNIRSGDGCSALCRTDGQCDNGAVEPGEECGEPGLDGVHCVHLGYDYGHLACDLCRFDATDCQLYEWQQIPVVVQPLHAVWGSAPDHVFAVGDRRTIARYDGTSWNASGDIENLAGLRALWGTGPDFAMATATDGTIWRHDGTSWTLFAQPIIERALTGIAGTGANDIHVVGEAGAFVHHDGTSWSILEPSPTERALHAVWASDPDLAFAVGDDGVFQYDGASWSLQAAPGDVPLFGVWGLASGQVFAVGAAGTIARYDGTTWTLDPRITDLDLHAIAGTAADDLYAVGARGVILHHDGLRWSQVRPATDGVDLHGVWAVSPDLVVAVGDRGRLLVHGLETWRAETVPTDLPLSALSGDPSDPSGQILAVGASGTVLRRAGGTWTVEPVPTSAWLHDVWVDAGEIYAVGEDWTVLHFQPTTATWTVEPTPEPATPDPRLLSVWASTDGTAYAVGPDSVLLRRSAATWSQIPVAGDGSVSGDFHDVTSDGASVYIAGEDGLFQWDGTTWRVLSSQGPNQSVWFGASNTVVAAGARGHLIAFLGNTLATIDSSTSYDLVALAGTATGPLYAVGAHDTMLDCRPTQDQCQGDPSSCTAFACAPIAPPAGVRDFRSIWIAEDGPLWLLSGDHDIHTLRLPDPG